jgi:excisionase family DNA binding protein
MDERKIFTTGQIAKICGVSLSTAKRWVERGEIHGFRLPGSGEWRIPRQELINFMERNAFPLDDLITSAGKKRILVVDDEKEILDLIERILSREGRFDLEFSQNGYEACIKVGNFKPDLVILDVMMPGINGLEVARVIKESKENNNVSILFLSGHLDDEMVDKLKKYSPHILAKSVSPEKLKSAVFDIIGVME